jgi:two-component SAPR family response regulator
MTADDPIPLRDKRILIVEDQYLIAADLSHVLAKLGGVIIGPVASAEAARAEIARGAVDLAFLDINLNEQMVFPLADELEKRGILFIFATGHDAAIVPERFKSKLRLEKPFTVQSVENAVRQLIPSS